MIPTVDHSLEEDGRSFKSSFRVALLMVATIWVIHIVQVIFNIELAQWGIYPRRWFGFAGIFTAPLIHGDFAHLFSNSAPILAMVTVIWYFFRRVAWKSFFFIYFLTGFAVWAFGRSVFHIGASGVVYGLVMFVMGNGIFRRNPKSIILSLIVVFFYSGMFVGILPNQEGISWESHLLGGIVGFLASFFYKEEIEVDEIERPDPFADEPARGDRPFFLSRDAFMMTRMERIRREQEKREEDL